METLNVIQGEDSWHAARLHRFTASECAAMMGDGYISRDALLQQKKSGVAPDISPFMQSLFDKGHAAEALARPLAEAIIEEEFYPVTGVSDCGKYLASFDGLTMNGVIGFEHKLLNQKLVAQIEAEDLDPKYYWQLEHQMMVSGAESILFVCSDGTEDNSYRLVYTAVDGRKERLIEGWTQFEKDLGEYTPPVPVIEIVGEIVHGLPSLAIEVTGKVLTTNHDEFKESAAAFIAGINMEPATDQDFANAENNLKACKAAEEKIVAAKDHMLGQMASVDDVSRLLDEIKSAIAAARLALEKTVKAKKAEKKAEIVGFGHTELTLFFNETNSAFPEGISLPRIAADFATVTKNKRTMASTTAAVNDEVARVKGEARIATNAITLNLELYSAHSQGYDALFPDLPQLVWKPSEDLVSTIKARIADHLTSSVAEPKQINDSPRTATTRSPLTPMTDYDRGYVHGLREGYDLAQNRKRAGVSVDDATQLFLASNAA